MTDRKDGAPAPAPAAPAPVESLTFEDAMRELEATVSRLETGEATLDEAIGLYERGAALRAHCERRLREAEERVERITLSRDGQPTGTLPVQGL